MTAQVIYLAIGLVAALFVAGVSYGYAQGEWPRIASDQHREDAGFATLLGLLSLVAWPIVVVIVLCGTGFAKHGWRMGRWQIGGSDADD